MIIAASSMNVVRNTSAFRLKTATRSVFQTMRHARTMALLKQVPVVVECENFSTEDGRGSRLTETESQINNGGKGEENEALNELMYPEPREFRDIHIKVETLDINGETRSRSRVTVFSNVDFLLGGKSSSSKSSDADDDESKSREEIQPKASILFEPNGRTRNKYRIMIYPAGATSSDGTTIEVDLFGNAKVVDK